MSIVRLRVNARILLDSLRRNVLDGISNPSNGNESMMVRGRMESLAGA